MFEDMEVITLSDKRDYLVLNKVFIDNKKYFVVISIDSKRESKLLEVIEDSSLMKVKEVYNKEVLKRVREVIMNDAMKLANNLENS